MKLLTWWLLAPDIIPLRRLARIAMLIIALIAALMVASLLSKLFGENAAGYLMLASCLVIYLGQLWAIDFLAHIFLASADINGLALLARNCSAGEIETVASGFHLFLPSRHHCSACPLYP